MAVIKNWTVKPRLSALELCQVLREETGCQHDLRFSEHIASRELQFIHDYNAAVTVSDIERGLNSSDAEVVEKLVSFIKACHS